MKKLLYILILIPLFSISQEVGTIYDDLYINPGSESEKGADKVWGTDVKNISKVWDIDVTRYDLTDDLVSVWEFDETSGSTANDSHGSNDGTISGATINQTGKLGKCYDFDGTDDYVDVGDDSSLRSSFGSPSSAISISAWINVDSYSSGIDQDIIVRSSLTNSGNYSFEFNLTYNSVNRELRMYANGANTAKIPSPNSIGVGSWKHVVVTHTGNAYSKIYVDGSYESTDVSAGSLGTSIETVFLGGRSGSSDCFDGLIDQVAIWKKSLSSDEIEYLYNDGDGVPYSRW